MDFISLKDAVSHIVDNRGKTCPTSDSGMPLIATNCVKSSSLYPTKEKIRYVNHETYETWFRGHPEPGDILFVNKGSPGEVCLVPDPVDFCIAQDMVSLRANEKKIDPSYLFAVLRDRRTKAAIENMHVGTMIPHFKKTDFDKLNLPLPSRPDQEFIGQLYLALSKRIALNQKINQTLEEIAKAIFKSWFVDFDPVRAKAEGRPTGLPPEISDLFPDELVDSEIGEIPKGWKLSMLSEVFDIQGGSQPPAKTFIDQEKEGYVRLLQIRDYDTSNHKTYVPAKNKLRLVDEDDVLIGRYGSGDGKFMEDSLGRPLRGLSGAINVAVVRTIPKLENSREFIATMVSSGLFYKWIVGGSARAVQAGFKKDDLDYINLSVPSSEILSVYEEFGALIWARTKIFREENRILAELRDTLLPKLISGELCIPDPEKFLKEVGI